MPATSKAQVFHPAATRAMAVVFDDVCRALRIPATATAAREVLAMQVLGLAGRIEPSAEDLRDRVLSDIRHNASGC